MDTRPFEEAAERFMIAAEFNEEAIAGAYPQLIVDQVYNEFNAQKLKYIEKQLIHLDIDPDVLAKQTLEIERLKSANKIAFENGAKAMAYTMIDVIKQGYKEVTGEELEDV